jgi:peptidoglycan/xylan/chitin deacetylase (PgdA/CDA1 family)
MRDWLKVQVVRALALPPVRAAARPVYAGDGVIFTLHRIVERPEETLVPGIAITAQFLEDIVRLVHASGREFIALSDVPRRLADSGPRKRWACLTFDDGYRDNLTLASPMLTRAGVPYTVFLVSDWVQLAAASHAALLERFVFERDRVELTFNGNTFDLATKTLAEKMAAYRTLDVMRWRDRTFDAAVPALLAAQGLDAHAVMRQLFLQRDDAARLASDGCSEIGSHTRRHLPLAHLSDDEARVELAESRDALGALLGTPPALIAYPFGAADQCGPREYEMARESGYSVGVTTRVGNVFRDDASHPLSLPRTGLSLLPHGHRAEFITASLDGSRNALMNRGHRARES